MLNFVRRDGRTQKCELDQRREEWNGGQTNEQPNKWHYHGRRRWFLTSGKRPSLSVSCNYPDMSNVSETFPFQAKRREKAEKSHGIMKVLCLILQRAFRIRGVDLHLENVSGRSWCISATSTVSILSTTTCRLPAQKTGVRCKMSSGTDKRSTKLLVFYYERIFWWFLTFETKFSKGKKGEKQIELLWRNVVEGPSHISLVLVKVSSC